MADLDEFDLKILRQMQKDCRQTGEQLAEQVGLSAAACLRRVQRLRKSGVIQKEVAVVSPKVFGKHVTLIVSITMAKESLDRDHNFKRAMRQLPEVVSCHHVTGDADFMLTLHMEDMEAYNSFVERHFYVSDITRYSTAVVMETVK